jgi:hypothetical protein
MVKAMPGSITAQSSSSFKNKIFLGYVRDFICYCDNNTFWNAVRSGACQPVSSRHSLNGHVRLRHDGLDGLRPDVEAHHCDLKDDPHCVTFKGLKA